MVGKERKAVHIVHHDIPKEAWPLHPRVISSQT
jgi:hypothetical protein